jgi:hypothetical protein
MAATGHHWEGRWRAGSRAPAPRARHSPPGGNSAARWRGPMGGGWAAAAARAAAEVGREEGERRVHPRRHGGGACAPRRGCGRWPAGACLEAAQVRWALGVPRESGGAKREAA